MPDIKAKKIIKRVLYALAAAAVGSIVLAAVLLYTVFPLKYGDIILAETQKYSLDQALIYAVIWTESKFDPDAESSAGATGLMQLLPSTAQWCAEKLNEDYSVDILTDPKLNIRLGVFYLAYLIDKYGEADALAAYNAGEGNLLKWDGEIEFKETRDYIKRVEFAKKVYKFKL